MTDRYGVVGNPVAHSKSPQIHSAFARQTGQDITYEAILAPLNGFAAAVGAFADKGGRGVNVTVPFKQEAYALADERTPRASAAGAANTLTLENGRVVADNTDGVGLVTDLTQNLGVGLAGKRVLLLGAGGATRGVLLPLLAQEPAALTVANRTRGKAETLAAMFASLPSCAISVRPQATGLDELGGEAFDVLINATAASLAGASLGLPEAVFGRGCAAYDMMYGKGDTPFMVTARLAGAALVADGLGMLVEQAAESFFIWRGVRPATAPVLATLRAA